MVFSITAYLRMMWRMTEEEDSRVFRCSGRRARKELSCRGDPTPEFIGNLVSLHSHKKIYAAINNWTRRRLNSSHPRKMKSHWKLHIAFKQTCGEFRHKFWLRHSRAPVDRVVSWTFPTPSERTVHKTVVTGAQSECLVNSNQRRCNCRVPRQLTLYSDTYSH